MAHDVVLIPGDGIGPEITQAMRRVVEATGVQINWNVQEAGAGVMDEFGTPLPQHVLDAVAETKVAIKGPITTPVGTGFRSVNVALRKHFDLYACVRPCLSQPGDGSRFRDVDLVIVRENTEDLYAGIEFDEGTAEVEELSQLVERLPKGHVMTVPATRFALEKIGRPLPGAAMLAGFASITGGLKLESIQQAYMARYPGKVGEANGAVAELAYQHIQQQLAQFKENC